MAASPRDMLGRHDIWQVMLRYSRGIDWFDRELLRSCYHDDAIDDHGVMVGEVEDIIDWAMGYHREYYSVHHHTITNHWCEIDGDTAHSETYYTFIAANHESPHSRAIGRYIDRLERQSGEWRIANRVCINELGCDLAETALPKDYKRVLMSSGPAARDRTDASYARPPVARHPG